MTKKDNEKYKSIDVQLMQGARSRHAKAIKALDAADDLVPDTDLGGTSGEIREAIKHLYGAAENLTEMLVYRKMMGVD